MNIKLLELNDIEFINNKRCENNVHKILTRNTRTFLPFIKFKKKFEEKNIHFVESKKDADCYFVGWGSTCNLFLEYEESIKCGIEFLKSLDKPFYFFDTSDSTSFHGILDIFKECVGIKYLKSQYLKDLNLYKNKSTFGRYWWPQVEGMEYGLSDLDITLLKNKLNLSNINWLYNKKYNPINQKKYYEYDVICLVGILNYKQLNYGKDVSLYYNEYRNNIFSKLEKLKKYNFKILTSQTTGKLNEFEYRDVCLKSKIMVSPHGFGDGVQAREMDAINFGNTIFKSNITNLVTSPNYDENTYVDYKTDLSDFEEKLVDTIKNFKEHETKILEVRKKIEYYFENFVSDTIKIL